VDFANPAELHARIVGREFVNGLALVLTVFPSRSTARLTIPGLSGT
jgi:hypothetical protein